MEESKIRPDSLRESKVASSKAVTCFQFQSQFEYNMIRKFGASCIRPNGVNRHMIVQGRSTLERIGVVQTYRVQEELYHQANETRKQIQIPVT